MSHRTFGIAPPITAAGHSERHSDSDGRFQLHVSCFNRASKTHVPSTDAVVKVWVFAITIHVFNVVIHDTSFWANEDLFSQIAVRIQCILYTTSSVCVQMPR